MFSVRDQDYGEVGVFDKVLQTVAPPWNGVSFSDPACSLTIGVHYDAPDDLWHTVYSRNVIALHNRAGSHDPDPQPIAHAALPLTWRQRSWRMKSGCAGAAVLGPPND